MVAYQYVPVPILVYFAIIPRSKIWVPVQITGTGDASVLFANDDDDDINADISALCDL